jgi:uncharacterized short protein YbdD (DUF466 family)
MKNLVRLVRELAGERAYEIYLEHQARAHPGEPVMTEREFWRARTDARDRNPKMTCC